LGQSEQDLQKTLGIPDSEASRLAHLLERSGAVAIELERLESLGVFVMTRADEFYPPRYKQRLKDNAPVILYHSGDRALLGQPGIAVVGSRHLDEAGMASAELVGNACGISGLVLYSGGAKGVDTISMKAALEARGAAVGVLGDSLERAIRNPDQRAAISRGDLCLVTPYTPSAPFSIGAAMGRNRLIYTLADYAIVVASDAEKGGTWAGATEALRAGWLPIFVLDHAMMPRGNELLLQKGALSFPHPFRENRQHLKSWLVSRSQEHSGRAVQLGLF
jgi:predicted Rossmann fold nucleotide-binding protein DprA/Smf involved in DNA uptake